MFVQHVQFLLKYLLFQLSHTLSTCDSSTRYHRLYRSIFLLDDLWLWHLLLFLYDYYETQ